MYLMPERKKSTVTHRLYIVHWYLQKSIIGTMIKYTQWQNILKATYFLKGNVVTSTKSFKELLFEPLTARRIKPVHPKGDQSWIVIGRTDDEAETPILWPPDAKSWLIWKDPDAGKDWRQEEKGMTEDEMVEWHHWLNGHESEWTPGVGDGQGGLACCSPWGGKESDITEHLT